MKAVPSGSYLVMSHPTNEVDPVGAARARAMWNASSPTPITNRSKDGIATFFDGLDLLEPGIVSCSQWHPDGNDTAAVSQWCGVARKP